LVRWFSWQQAPAFFGEPVFLQAAVGFVWEGALDETGGYCGLLVMLPEVLFVPEVKLGHDFRSRHLANQQPKHPPDFGGDFGGNWGLHDILGVDGFDSGDGGTEEIFRESEATLCEKLGNAGDAGAEVLDQF